jgi:predicted AAA+ superfamily ATPase
MSALKPLSLEEALGKPEHWGRLVETAVGNFLANTIKGTDLVLDYWAGRNREVDFILSRGQDTVAIEVKSGRRKAALPGMEAFSKEFKFCLLANHSRAVFSRVVLPVPTSPMMAMIPRRF